MKKAIVLGMFLGVLMTPGVVSAQTLTGDQVNSIIGLLQAFGVDQTTISIVYSDLVPSTPITDSTTTPVVVPQIYNPPAQQPVVNNTLPVAGTSAPVVEPAPTCFLQAVGQGVNGGEGNQKQLVIANWKYTPADASTSIDGLGVIPGGSNQSYEKWWWTGIILDPGVYTYTMEVDTDTASTTCSSTVNVQ